MEYFSAIKKNEIMSFAETRMGLKIVILSQTDKYHMISHIWNLKEGYKWTYLQNRNRVTDVEKKTYGYQGVGVGNKLED